MKLKKTYKVTGITQVHVPSVEFPHVPYYVYLLEDDQGNRRVWKHSKEYVYHDRIDIVEQIETSISMNIGVIGSGITGIGIVSVALSKRCNVRLFVRKKEKNVQIQQHIVHQLTSLVGKEKADNLIKNLLITNTLHDFSKIPFIIEAISENKREKIAVYKKLENIIKRNAIIATNTSSLSIESLSKTFINPSRFISMHFFNPVTKMKLVEITKSTYTNNKTLQVTKKLAEQLDKFPICLRKNSEGFIVNRLLFSLLAEAVRLEHEGIATKEDIDTAIELGLHHPLGPFKLMDIIGLDVSLHILKSLPNVNKKKTNLHALEVLVVKENLGKKSGKGFYVYNKK